MNNTVIFNKRCRICKSTHFTRVFDLGKTPLANAFLKKNELRRNETFYTLRVYLCNKCKLMQLRDIVSPQILFKDYVYVSSTSPVFIRHFEEFANTVKHRFKIQKNDLVIDIGSNDGILLNPFHKRGIRVLGIEPAKNIAKLANRSGVETIAKFFSVSLAQKIRRQHGPATLITATNVFAHINNLDTVINGVRQLLTQEGVFIIEVPYLVDFLQKNLFDTVYHEHLSYFALHPLIRLFDRFDMRIFDVERVDSHGGSIRVYVAHLNATYHETAGVNQLLKLEKHLQLDQLTTYKYFAHKVIENKKRLRTILTRLKKQGETIAGYGAPAKGNTLLNYFGISKDTLTYIVDDSPFKQGLYTPGTHIPVVAPDKLKTHPPDYLLILAWNFAPSIMKRYTRFHQRGRKFIVPVPAPKVV